MRESEAVSLLSWGMGDRSHQLGLDEDVVTSNFSQIACHMFVLTALMRVGERQEYRGLSSAKD